MPAVRKVLVNMRSERNIGESLKSLADGERQRFLTMAACLVTQSQAERKKGRSKGKILTNHCKRPLTLSICSNDTKRKVTASSTWRTAFTILSGGTTNCCRRKSKRNPSYFGIADTMHLGAFKGKR